MTVDTRIQLYESVASLRHETFELLDRVQWSAGSGNELVSALAVRLQGIANQLGAVEALVAPLPDAASA